MRPHPAAAALPVLTAEEQRQCFTGVYFVQGGNGGPIKIGRTHSLIARLEALQTGSPVQLNAVGFVHGGGPRFERAMHKRFARDRLHGEWFQSSPALRLFLALLGASGLIAIPPEWVLEQDEDFRHDLFAFLDRVVAWGEAIGWTPSTAGEVCPLVGITFGAEAEECRS